MKLHVFGNFWFSWGLAPPPFEYEGLCSPVLSNLTKMPTTAKPINGPRERLNQQPLQTQPTKAVPFASLRGSYNIITQTIPIASAITESLLKTNCVSPPITERNKKQLHPFSCKISLTERKINSMKSNGSTNINARDSLFFQSAWNV